LWGSGIIACVPETLSAWIAGEVTAAFGLSPYDAEAVAVVASASAVRAAEVVALCRVTSRLPWAAEWWQTDAGRRAFETLATCPDDAWTALNEMCAAPAPDAIDPNWTDERVFEAVDRPLGCEPGDEFVLGDGQGSRFLMRVIERDGQVGAELLRCLGAPLDSYWHQAVSEAERLARKTME
jgi:hypothetical protein